MKVCIPTMGNNGLNEIVGEHFGRVPTFTMYDTETSEVKVFPNTSEHMGGFGLPAEILAKEGVDTMICSGLGRRAIQIFEQHGIMVYIGAYGTVKDALDMWKDKKLQMATDENACAQHAYRKEDHEGCGKNHKT